MSERLLNATEVALAIGISVHTLDLWYRFKRQYPQNEYAKILPAYTKKTMKSNRYWKQSDIWRLMDFKKRIPKGRSGIMGSVTQRYVKRTKEDNNGKEKVNSAGGSTG